MRSLTKQGGNGVGQTILAPAGDSRGLGLKGPARSPIKPRAPLRQPPAPNGSSPLCPAGFGVPTAPRRQGSLQARSLSCPPLPSPPVPAQPRARVCYCEGARGEEGGGAHAGAGACPWAPRRERAVRAAGRGRRGGARHPRRPRSGSPTRIGSRRRERARARRVVPGGGRARRRRRPRRSAGRRAEEEERREEGEGREEAPARLPAKRPYLPGHSLSLPGGRLRVANPLPPGSSSRGAAEGAARPQRWARGAAGPCWPGQHLGRLPASSAPMPGSP